MRSKNRSTFAFGVFGRAAVWGVFLLCGSVLPLAAQNGPLTCSASTSTTRPIRASEIAALVGEIEITCTGGTPTAAGNPVPTVDVQVYFNTDYTGRILGTFTETLLLIDRPAPASQVACTSNPNQCGWTGGTKGPNVFPSQSPALNAVAFYGIPLDPPGNGGTRRFTIRNVRLDVSAIAVPTPPAGVPITASVSMTTVSVQNPNLVVGTATAAVTVQVMDATSSAPVDGTTGAGLPTCTGGTQQRIANLRVTPIGPSLLARTIAPFTATDVSSTPAAQNLVNTVYSSDSDFYNPNFPATGNMNMAGLAQYGTRIQATLSQLPTGVTVWVGTVPVTYSQGNPVANGAGQPRARLVTTDRWTFAPQPATTIIDGIPVTALTVTNGNATAVWEIQFAGNTPASVDFPVWISYLANTSALNPAQVRIQLAPVSADRTSSDDAPIPRFVDDATTQPLFSLQPTCTNGSITVAPSITGNGVRFSVDGYVYTTAQKFNWSAGSTHVLSVSSPTAGANTRVIALGWSDAGALTHTISAPGVPTTYTALFKTQHKLTATATPAQFGGVSANPASPDGFYDANTNVQVTATANSGYKFLGFKGSLTGATNPQTLQITAPATVTAEFAVIAPLTSTISVTPSTGTGSSPTFQAVYQGALGYQSLKWVQMLVATATDGGGQPYCLMHYDVKGQAFWLYSDTYGFFAGPIPAGTHSADLAGTDCALSTLQSTVSGNGLTLQLNLRTEFKIAGSRNIYLRAYDDAGTDTGWVQRGTWTQQASPTQQFGVTQATPTGSSQTFTLDYVDPAGFTGISKGWYQFLIAADSTGGGLPFCYVHYDRAGNGFWVYSGDVGFFVGPVAPGAASNLLTSSACSLDVANATATQLADRLQEKVPVVLKAPMSGTKKMFMRSQDVLGRDSGWVQVGTYQVP
ncbi:InlB B-repeat-containing protein [Paludibaculum fermentans]|uniref:Bacterial repeat domain-containing protein n=1 Tax=Paludibaculum fermentans TaxID=1473598 RepID=A0A7S7NXK5_PALFE|nr:hypothetical protein [Paludibaculum fermentans]QOY91034.1 hypothetical protein IRI77_14140 [Paludibaculum fermentans]